MRNRIITTQINGKVMPIVRCKSIFGEEHTAVLATSETPEHAQSNIRKVLAHKKARLQRNEAKSMSCQADRRAKFLALGKASYRTFYLN